MHTLSEPARSTRFSFPILKVFNVFSNKSLIIFSRFSSITSLSTPSFLLFTLLIPSLSSLTTSSDCSAMRTKTACERLESSFNLVELVALWFDPWSISLYLSFFKENRKKTKRRREMRENKGKKKGYTSLGDLTTHSLKPSTNTPLFLSSLIAKCFLSGFSRSLISSL